MSNRFKLLTLEELEDEFAFDPHWEAKLAANVRAQLAAGAGHYQGPRAYRGHQRVRTSKVIERFDGWPVTTYGVEFILDAAYYLDKARIGRSGWVDHIAGKEWAWRSRSNG
jgi:hypothetical protein